MEIAAHAVQEQLVAVARRNGGKAGIGITVVFSSALEGCEILPGCKRWSIVVQDETSKQPRCDPTAVARMSYKPAVKAPVLVPLSDEYFRQVTGAQVTEDWYPMRLGRVTSTGDVRNLAFGSATPTVREEGREAEAVLQSAG